MATLDLRTPGGRAIRLARQALLQHIDRAGQARGITLARQALELSRPVTPPGDHRK